MKIQFFLNLLLFFYIHPVYSNPSEVFLVQVESGSCSMSNNKKLGSGILFTKQNSAYVLTSDHVLYHDFENKTFCSHIVFKNNRIKTQLKSVHVGRGVALLKVLSENSFSTSQLKKYEELFSTDSAFMAQDVILGGFPFKANSLSLDPSAQIINPKSKRMFLPLIKTSIEVRGYSEYGMSGGALMDTRHKVLGVISHQYLHIKNAGMALKELQYETENPEGEEIIAQIIPFLEIKEWIEKSISGFQIGNSLDPNLEQIKKISTTIDGLRYQWLDCDLQSYQNRPSFPKTIGGDGVGIGGDGVGIGGHEQATLPPHIKSHENCPGLILIEMATENSQQLQNDYTFVTSIWGQKLKQKINPSTRAYFSAFLTAEGNYKVPSSLTHFLIGLEKGWVPLVKIQQSFENIDITRTQKLATKMNEQLQTLLPLFPKDSEPFLLLEQVQNYLKFVQNDQEEVLSHKILQDWLNSPIWKQIYVQVSLENYSIAINLYSNLLRMDEIQSKGVL
ncbi:MAG TPA: serine protease [Pseudobdellovibrionaceae bacterium]|nr:serine protease [Pseudobdellovibrionaceae bacterium]